MSLCSPAPLLVPSGSFWPQTPCSLLLCASVSPSPLPPFQFNYLVLLNFRGEALPALSVLAQNKPLSHSVHLPAFSFISFISHLLSANHLMGIVFWSIDITRINKEPTLQSLLSTNCVPGVWSQDEAGLLLGRQGSSGSLVGQVQCKSSEYKCRGHVVLGSVPAL